MLADNGNKRAALALRLSENYDKLISTILIGNNIVNIMVASIGTLLFVDLYGDIGATVSTAVVTIVVLILERSHRRALQRMPLNALLCSARRLSASGFGF